MACRDADLVTATGAFVDASVRCRVAGGMDNVERRVLRLGQRLTVLVESQDGSFRK